MVCDNPSAVFAHGSETHLPQTGDLRKPSGCSRIATQFRGRRHGSYAFLGCSAQLLGEARHSVLADINADIGGEIRKNRIGAKWGVWEVWLRRAGE